MLTPRINTTCPVHAYKCSCPCMPTLRKQEFFRWLLLSSMEEEITFVGALKLWFTRAALLWIVIAPPMLAWYYFFHD